MTPTKSSLHDDRPALILGNGPSLDIFPHDLLPHFYTYGCNHIYKLFKRWGGSTNAVVITDSYRLQEIGDAYRDFPGDLWIGDQRYINPPISSIRKLVKRDFHPIRQLKKETLTRFPFFDRIRWTKYLFNTVFQKSKISFDLKLGLNFGSSVVFSAIQLAAIRGHKTILLTGVDANYQQKGQYFQGMHGASRKINPYFTDNPRVYLEPALVLAQICLEAMGVDLIDCTSNGNLRFISKGTLMEQFPYYQKTKAL